MYSFDFLPRSTSPLAASHTMINKLLLSRASPGAGRLLGRTRECIQSHNRNNVQTSQTLGCDTRDVTATSQKPLIKITLTRHIEMNAASKRTQTHSRLKRLFKEGRVVTASRPGRRHSRGKGCLVLYTAPLLLLLFLLLLLLLLVSGCDRVRGVGSEVRVVSSPAQGFV